jgi:hypothetical protein
MISQRHGGLYTSVKVFNKRKQSLRLPGDDGVGLASDRHRRFTSLVMLMCVRFVCFADRTSLMSS